MSETWQKWAKHGRLRPRLAELCPRSAPLCGVLRRAALFAPRSALWEAPSASERRGAPSGSPRCPPSGPPGPPSAPPRGAPCRGRGRRARCLPRGRARRARDSGLRRCRFRARSSEVGPGSRQSLAGVRGTRQQVGSVDQLCGQCVAPTRPNSGLASTISLGWVGRWRMGQIWAGLGQKSAVNLRGGGSPTPLFLSLTEGSDQEVFAASARRRAPEGVCRTSRVVERRTSRGLEVSWPLVQPFSSTLSVALESATDRVPESAFGHLPWT